MIELNKIYNEDCVLTMSRMDNESVDLVVTSPPYEKMRKYNGFSWDFDKTATELWRIIKPGGVVVWVINDPVVKGTRTGESFRQALRFIEIGFKLNDTMIWRKTNPIPQFKQPRYLSAFEYMFVFSKGKPKTWHPIVVPTKYGGYHYNSTGKVVSDGEAKRRKLKYVVNDAKIKENVWDIGVANNRTKHTAVFPDQLAIDHVLTWSNEGDIVYDPFLGRGTTAKAARLNNRNYIGSEISEEYCKIAEQYINEEPILKDLF